LFLERAMMREPRSQGRRRAQGQFDSAGPQSPITSAVYQA
jgi:hypothetical protein